MTWPDTKVLLRICATLCRAQGNQARYINHSCAPNAYTKIVTVGGVKHVAIIAARAIPAGEELAYDYKARPLS